ncbi:MULTISPECIES: hypothetical protein [unclassified Campylobacter]|uniref:hypothetical protein n=1 Tax=unclassified Campylobacter TaxID=2593542 RepID=UPI001238192D|nr:MULTISPECIES: hypothetical protein [unclassified Campylobacter]KAA6226448.1 hypothetical protein FMM54_04215 [Campylobacter sp. LR185c]KAA6228584.1 hypothetical protein FMM55_00775 [Campylobacter sp. LR196d]KAA6229137.1 hypothetical protein FMM57_01060 [Campylobacter sp. LR286c]KAA6233928.1 hypothetical protein FMM58_01190 [Campylobacter sp. LR291e]KAA6234167.1 hypothetical protein FMM56_01115 [Campylobacter sp. LR264d]
MTQEERFEKYAEIMNIIEFKQITSFTKLVAILKKEHRSYYDTLANDFKLISTIYRAYKREIIQVSVDNEILVVRELTNSPNEVERLKN